MGSFAPRPDARRRGLRPSSDKPRSRPSARRECRARWSSRTSGLSEGCATVIDAGRQTLTHFSCVARRKKSSFSSIANEISTSISERSCGSSGHVVREHKLQRREFRPQPIAIDFGVPVENENFWIHGCFREGEEERTVLTSLRPGHGQESLLDCRRAGLRHQLFRRGIGQDLAVMQHDHAVGIRHLIA